MSVYPLAYLKNDVQTSENFLCTLPVAVARFSSNENYVLPVLWMTSCLHIEGPFYANMTSSMTWLRGCDSQEGRTESIPPLIGLRCMLKMTHQGAKPGRSHDVCDCLVMAALCNRGPLYFCPVVSVFLFFPRLISAAADWMSTIILHMAWP